MDDSYEFNRIYCNKCKRVTNHKLIAEHEVTSDFQDHSGGENEAETSYCLWACAGCETATLEELEPFYGYNEYGEPELEWMSNFYPPRTQEHYIANFTPRLQTRGGLTGLRHEVIASYNNGLKLLCAVGIRAWVEGICEKEGISGRNLHVRINQLESRLGSQDFIQGFHTLREIGNKAAHELETPDMEVLRKGIELLDKIMEYLYELPRQARGIHSTKERRIRGRRR